MLKSQFKLTAREKSINKLLEIGARIDKRLKKTEDVSLQLPNTIAVTHEIDDNCSPPCTSRFQDCKFCGRPFQLNRIALHEEICYSSSVLKRTEKRLKSAMCSIHEGSDSSNNTPLGANKEDSKALRNFLFPSRNNFLLERQFFFKHLPPRPNTPQDEFLCNGCGRRFTKEIYQDHVQVCRCEDRMKTSVISRAKVERDSYPSFRVGGNFEIIHKRRQSGSSECNIRTAIPTYCEQLDPLTGCL